MVLDRGRPIVTVFRKRPTCDVIRHDADDLAEGAVGSHYDITRVDLARAGTPTTVRCPEGFVAARIGAFKWVLENCDGIDGVQHGSSYKPRLAHRPYMSRNGPAGLFP
jgi:hypothetical protein